MGLLRYVVQGIGWRVGAEIAEEGIDEARARQQAAQAPPPSAAEIRRSERRDAAAAKKAAREQKKADARHKAKEAADKAAFEREFQELKNKVSRDR